MASTQMIQRTARWFPDWTPAHELYLELAAGRSAPSSRVLHLGAGRDMLGVARALPGRALVAVDIDAGGLSANPHALRVSADAALLPFEAGCFDAIVCEHVFEHLADPSGVLVECARVLKPEGALVFLTPNRWSYVALAAALTPHWFHGAYRKRLAGISEADTFPTFYRLNSFRRIGSLGRKVGLFLDTQVTVTGPPTYLELNEWLHRAGVALHWLLERGPSACQVSLVGVLTRRTGLESG